MRSQREREIQALVAMRLIADGRSRTEVAGILGISEPQLGRDIKDLDQYVDVVRTFRKDILKRRHPDLYDEVMDFELADDLEAILRERFDHAPAVKAFAVNKGGELARLDEFAVPTANYLSKLLTRSKLVGLTWGGTILSISKKIRPHPTQKSTIQFLPLCGEAPRSENYALYSSSTLALRFHETFNAGFAKQPDLLSLGSVPMMLPSGLEPKVRDVVKRVFQHQSMAYEAIFGHQDSDTSKRLIDKVDTIVSGVGSHKHPYGYISDDFLRTHTSLTREKLGSNVHGDIAGHLLPRPDVSATAKRDIQKLNDAILGLQIDDVQRCAQRARDSNRPGVIIVAIGNRKAKAVLDIIERGLVNTLLCDNSLKQSLKSALRSR